MPHGGFEGEARAKALCNPNCEFRQRFLTFCQDTELNGLMHVPQTGSRILRAIYIISFLAGTVAVLFLFAGTLNKYMAQPKGINLEFVTDDPIPFPELNICRYMVGLSASRLHKYNVSVALAKLLHWRLEALEVNYSPGFIEESEVRRLLSETHAEYLGLKTRLGMGTFYELIRFLLPSYTVIGHPLRAIVYEKGTGQYTNSEVKENWITTYVEDLYLYNAICHRLRTSVDSVLVLVIPFPLREEFETKDSQMRQLLPLLRSFLIMDGNHAPIARVEPGRKYWAGYKLKSSYLMNTKEQACIDTPDYHQQGCIQACFGKSVHASPHCKCQSVFMQVHFGAPGTVDICDPWDWIACNSTDNAAAQSHFVNHCVNECLRGCRDQSYEYTLTSVADDTLLSPGVGWEADFLEISENRSVFTLSPSSRPNAHIRVRQYPLVDLVTVLTMVHALVYWGRQAVEIFSSQPQSAPPQENSRPLVAFP